MAKIVLILGNGFDLDLGLKSNYKDFVESAEWKSRMIIINELIDKCQSYKPYSLFLHLEKQSKESQWFDIEESIRDFVKIHHNCQSNIIPIIRNEFDWLRSDLKKYIRRVSNEFEPIESKLAYMLISSLQRVNISINIESFNYTDCFQLCKLQAANPTISYTHVHNSIYDERIVLGCRFTFLDYGQKNFSFLSKANMIQNANHLYDNLSEAQEVIFFGHSLNQMDYCYFEIFFNLTSSPKDKLQRLIFITKNEESELSIRENLGQDTNISIYSHLKGVDFIHTDYFYSGNENEIKKWDNLIDRIKER